jgi:hypothetical protein
MRRPDEMRSAVSHGGVREILPSPSLTNGALTACVSGSYFNHAGSQDNVRRDGLQGDLGGACAKRLHVSGNRIDCCDAGLAGPAQTPGIGVRREAAGGCGELRFECEFLSYSKSCGIGADNRQANVAAVRHDRAVCTARKHRKSAKNEPEPPARASQQYLDEWLGAAVLKSANARSHSLATAALARSASFALT